MCFIFSNSVLGAVNNNQVLADEVNLGVIDSTTMRGPWTFFITQFIGLGVTLAAGARALKIIGQQFSNHSIIHTHTFGPLAFHIDHELRGFVVGSSPMAL